VVERANSADQKEIHKVDAISQAKTTTREPEEESAMKDCFKIVDELLRINSIQAD